MPWEPERIVDELLARVISRVTEHVPWRPGARELLSALRDEGVPSALVTMSWRSLADAVVGALPEGTFAAVVTGDEVSHGKPHPEPYRAAARLLGVSPEDCVAIEDSPTGVRSAVAAGVPTLAVPHVVAVPEIRGAVHLRPLSGLTPAGLRARRRARPQSSAGTAAPERAGSSAIAEAPSGSGGGVPPHAGQRSRKSHQSHSREVRGRQSPVCAARTTASQMARTLRSTASRSRSSGA